MGDLFPEQRQQLCGLGASTPSSKSGTGQIFRPAGTPTSKNTQGQRVVNTFEILACWETLVVSRDREGPVRPYWH